ncbi:MAG TPA: CRISPR-associated endonuclease Cas2 [Fibrobacteria bacterium]|nr:CRISPR-associated endonuclease Cas2 [Fibrobacteria bacterium]HOX50316.1 CRISPR-associated endonuclease Cas2 [Fibrobacteria bacterium]
MLVLVTYDVSTTTPEGRNRLRSIAKACEGFGMRVQNSVFECNVDPARWELLKTRLLRVMSPKADSLRFYFLGSSWERRIEHHGSQISPDMNDLLMV